VDAAGDRMIDLGHQTEVPHRRIAEHGVERVDRTDRDIRLAQPPHDLVGAQRADAALEQRDERGPVRDPQSVVREPRVLSELVEIDRPAEALEQRVVGAADVHVAVRRGERLIGHDRGVDVAFRARHRALGEPPGGLSRQQGDLPADHRRVDRLPEAGPRPRMERRGDREGGEHPGDHVRLGDPDHRRHPIRLAGEAHDPAHPLDDEVVRRPGPPRAVLAEPGDLAVDRARVQRGDALLREPESGHRPRTEILDDDIGSLDEPLECRLPRGMLEVEGDAALVPVDREVVRRHAVLVRGRPAPRLVAGPRLLDLDDLGAVVGEHERAVRTGERPGQVDDADAMQCALGRSRTVRHATADRGKRLEGVAVGKLCVGVTLLAVHDERSGIDRRNAE